VSDDGDVYATGFVKGALHVGDQMIGGDGIFVAMLAPDGALSWARTFGSSAGMQADRGLALTTAAGGVLVSGSYAGVLDFGGGGLGPGGAFVTMLNGGGQHVWSRGLPGTAAFVAGDGATKHVLVATNDDGGAMTVLAFGQLGDMLWSQDYSPGAFTSIAVDPSGNVLLAGNTTTADFGGGPLPSPLPNGEGFLVGLDPTGHHRFTHGLPFDTSQSTAAAIAVAPNGDVAVTGNYVHHVDSSTVIKSAFLVTVDPAGKALKSLTFGPTDGLGSSVTQQGWGVAPGPKPGSFYVGGDFYAQIDIAGASLVGDGTSDLFVARLPP
jgi:hypothetical protein